MSLPADSPDAVPQDSTRRVTGEDTRRVQVKQDQRRNAVPARSLVHARSSWASARLSPSPRDSDPQVLNSWQTGRRTNMLSKISLATLFVATLALSSFGFGSAQLPPRS